MPATHKRVTRIPSRLPSWYWGGDSHLATNWYQWYSCWGEETGECIPPTLAEFRARFPEFSEIPDATVQIAISDATCFADGTWIDSEYCKNCKVAIALLAAHFLASQLIMASTLPNVAPLPDGGFVIAGGEVTSLRFETMSVGFSPSKASGGGGGGGTASGGEYCDFCMTPYGSRYLDMLKVNQPAIAVV
jgi:hypothetical protein